MWEVEEGGGNCAAGGVGFGRGGGGGNGIGGAVDESSTATPGAGIAYGGGGGGGGYVSNAVFGGAGKEGAIFVYIIMPWNGCLWNMSLAAQSSEWTRAHTDCVDLDGAKLNGRAMTYNDLNEKRKATIFQYKKNSAGFSKKQQYSRIARGLGQKKTTYATQSATYTNPNTNNLVLDASSVLICPGRAKNWAWTSQNDTPGPMRKITNEPSVPLTNYIVRRTYLAGNNKWPQLGALDPNYSSSSSSSFWYTVFELNYPSNNSIIYNNRILLDYVTYNRINDYIIKILVNNTVHDDKTIYPSSLTDGNSPIVIDTPDNNKYNITLQTYTNNNIPFPAGAHITVHVLVPTVEIANTDMTIYNNTFDLSYTTTNLGNNKLVLYNGDTRMDNVTTNPYTVTYLISGDYTFKLEIENDNITPDPVIISEKQVTIKVPTVEIANTQTTIYNNTFDLSYNVTNLGDENKIVLYNGDTRIDNITDPYTFTDLNDGVYTFKLEIENDNMIANPVIDSEKQVTIKVPTIEIANTDITIYNNTFDLSYNVTNLGDENKIVLYNGDTRIDNITDPYTFTDLNDGAYTFKLEIENDNMIANPAIISSMNITIALPTVEITSPSTYTTVNNNTFIIEYDVANIPDAYTLVLYEMSMKMSTTLNDNCDKQIGSNTVTVESPPDGTYTYQLKNII